MTSKSVAGCLVAKLVEKSPRLTETSNFNESQKQVITNPKQGKNMPTKRDVIEQLEIQGNRELAEVLRNWKSDVKTNQGWDSWFKSEHPDVAQSLGMVQNAKPRKENKRNVNVTGSKKKSESLTKKKSKLEEDAAGHFNVEIRSIRNADVAHLIGEMRGELSRKEDGRLFDAYCFADYRGGRVDSNGVEVALGFADCSMIYKMTDVINRTKLRAFWIDFIKALNAANLRLIFGQDHQYSFPKSFLEELGLKGTWRESMRQLFFGNVDGFFEIGRHAQEGEAGRFAKAINEKLGDKGNQIFFSRTKGDQYGIPKSDPRGESHCAYRKTEELLKQYKKKPFPFNQIGDNGSVGGQSIVGIPNLIKLLEHPEVGSSVRIWPFDGFEVLIDKSHLCVEVYPTAIRPESVSQTDFNDAMSCVIWCKEKDQKGQLGSHLSGETIPQSEKISDFVKLEGWVLGSH
jgi:hypothetical protein